MRSVTREIAVFVTLSNLAGCGLIMQGTNETLRIATNPSGAEATFAGVVVSTPATITVRRSRGWRVLRAEKQGYVSACKLLRCDMNTAVILMDVLPAAIPLAIDAMFGALHVCGDEVSVELEPLRPGDIYPPLPSDDEILRSRGQPMSLCQLYNSSRVLIFPGEPPRAYEILGEVSVTESDMTKYGLRVTPQSLDRAMKQKAVDTYGDKVDALIGTGTTFEGTRLGYNVMTGFRNQGAQGFARALAVRFTGATAKKTATQSITERLRDLEEARRSGLITQEEFDAKKAKMLDEL